MSFEKKIKRLEEIVEKMENSEIPLEESLKLFEEGVKLSKECNQDLVKAENKVKVLVSQNEDGSIKTEDFKENDAE